MSYEEEGNKALWFIAGAALGATIALLYAPESGRETRRRLARKANRGAERLSEQGQELLDRGRDLYGKGVEMADEAAGLFERGRKLVEG